MGGESQRRRAAGERAVAWQPAGGGRCATVEVKHRMGCSLRHPALSEVKQMELEEHLLLVGVLGSMTLAPIRHRFLAWPEPRAPQCPNSQKTRPSRSSLQERPTKRGGAGKGRVDLINSRSLAAYLLENLVSFRAGPAPPGAHLTPARGLRGGEECGTEEEPRPGTRVLPTPLSPTLGSPFSNPGLFMTKPPIIRNSAQPPCGLAFPGHPFSILDPPGVHTQETERIPNQEAGDLVPLIRG